MVIRDLSYLEATPAPPFRGGPAGPIPVASVTDRFLAFILDMLIFSPIVSFAVAGILRKLKTVLILNSEAEEAMVLWGVFVLGILIVSSFLQSLFLYFWQASPGQKFLQLQVVAYPLQGNTKLSFGQCLLRSVSWWVGLMFFGIPFLEVLGHPLRRAFHERISDTLVVSLKQEAVDLPMALETQYIRSTLWTFFGALFFVGAVFLLKSYKQALRGGLVAGRALPTASCPALSSEKYSEQKRLDMALALYFAEEVDEACVYAEAQNAVWNRSGEDKALGQLAMAMISQDEKDAAAYKEKICLESRGSEACAIAEYLKAEAPDRGNVLRRAGLGLVSSRLLLLKDSMELANYASAVGLIQDLEPEEPLQSYLQRNLVRAAWALNEKWHADKGARSPASKSEQDILRDFKKRYDIK